MKKFITLSFVAATMLFIGGCGNSTDVVNPVNAGLDGVAPGSGLVQGVQVENPAGTNENGKPSGLEEGRFVRASSPQIKSLFFPANNGLTGTELYRYDLVSGTYTYTDINPGAAGSNPMFLTEVDGKIYFSANDGVNGRELWVYDGATNTASIRNLNVTSGVGSNPSFITELNGILYFAANDGTGEGTELYYYNPQNNQHGYVRNHLLQTLRPGVASSNPSDLKVQDGVLYFSANAGPVAGVGRELYRYDPVLDKDTGPVLIADVNPGAAGSNPRFMADIDGKVFFRANDGTTGTELWVYDSSSNTTRQVRDINPGVASSNPRFLTADNDTIFFSANNGNPAFGNNVELMKYDISLDIMTTASDISLATGTFPSYLTKMDNGLFFSGFRAITLPDNGGIEYTGMELWRYDLDTGNVKLVDNLAKGLFQGSNPYWITEANGMLYFGAMDSPLNGRELWKSDGFNQSQPLGNFNPGPGNFLPPVGYNYPYETLLKTTW